MGLKRARDLASGGYAHFWKRLREASVRCQEAARAYQRGCKATDTPAKRLFSEEKERRWTAHNSPQSVQNGTERNKTKRNSMRTVWDVVRQRCTLVSCAFLLNKMVLN